VQRLAELHQRMTFAQIFRNLHPCADRKVQIM
jgi:hypothetical protein